MRVTVHLRRHSSHRPDQLPTWIRRDAVTKVLGPPAPEALAEVHDHRGTRVGMGLFSPDSDIPVRVLWRGEKELPEDWLSRRVHQALEARARLALEDTTGYREINAEGDGLPGLTVDRYGDHRVIQLTTAPMLARREEIAAALRDHTPRPTIWTVPEAAARRESIPALCEGESPDLLSFREYGMDLATTPPPSQKTGAYHDQRENRRRVASLARRSYAPLSTAFRIDATAETSSSAQLTVKLLGPPVQLARPPWRTAAASCRQHSSASVAGGSVSTLNSKLLISAINAATFMYQCRGARVCLAC